jgi:hypothetical protein
LNCSKHNGNAGFAIAVVCVINAIITINGKMHGVETAEIVADNSKWRITEYFNIAEIGGRFVLRRSGG